MEVYIMSKKKYYAIKIGKGVKNRIVDTWSECKELVLGYNSTYKSFKTREEAMEYLGFKVKQESNTNTDEEEKVVKKPKKRKGKNQDVLKVNLDKELYKSFQDKCNEMGMSEEMIIKNMIMEWLE